MLLLTLPLDFDYHVFREYEQFDKVIVWPPRHINVGWRSATLDSKTVFAGELAPEVKKLITTWVCNPDNQMLIERKDLAQFPNLRVLATASTGTNHIDLGACKERGIKVISLLDDREGLSTISASSEYTFKLLLDGFRLPPARELQNKVVGIVGFGRIGHRMLMFLQAFGAEWAFYDPPYMLETYGERGFNVSLKWMFHKCDAVVICCALTDETRGMVTQDLIASMKENAILVNTARGEIIDEPGLIAVKKQRKDLKVLLDVVCGEVTDTTSLNELKACGILVSDPLHQAGRTLDSRTKAARIILELLKKEAQNETSKPETSHSQDDGSAESYCEKRAASG